MHVPITIFIFIATLALMLIRPRGLHEAWAAAAGAVAMLILGVETWRQAWSTITQGVDVLLFLLALMMLSTLLDASGFFEWSALTASKAARGDVGRLFRNIFLLGSTITAFLSLDTTAIILTPIVMAFVDRLKLRARPFLIACAMVANTASLLLPVSNLTNLLYQSRMHFNFGVYTARMALPQIAAIAVGYIVLATLYRRDLADGFDQASIPEASTAIKDRPFFLTAVVTLVVILIGYFVGSALHIPPYVIALGGCVILTAVGVGRRRIRKRTIVRDVDWRLFPFVIGLFVVIRGVENLGLTNVAARVLSGADHSTLAQILTSTFAAGVGTNVVNNIPMALLSLSVLGKIGNPTPQVYGTLIGCNIGPNLTIVGSLATMLVLSSARKRGEDVSGFEFFRAGVIVTPIMLTVASLALWLVLR